MTVAVSVVVPVYNGARHLQPLVDSLLEQSMSPESFEAVFVDDGSTDDTPRLLDDLAAAHPHLRVIHQPNSGWPGKPRNIGVDAARGDYVFFADHDDWLGAEALERMHATAVRTGADVVLGRMVGHGRGVPREVFRRNVDRATLADAPLVDSMTPHKLFRRSFLDGHALRFPEERRRLEDHVFVMRAYLLANYASIVADYDCYHHAARDDDSNVTKADLDAAGYYQSVREVLDIVAAHVEPGRLRDRLYRRYLRIEMLGRLDSDEFAYDAQHARALWPQLRAVYVDCIPDSVVAPLPVRQRLLCDLLARDAYDDAVATVRWARSLDVDATAGPAADGVEVRVVLRARPRLVEGRRLAPPLRTSATTDLDVTADLERVRVDVVLRRAGRERLVRAQARATVAGSEVHCVASAQLAWPDLVQSDATVRLRAMGWHVERPVRTRGGVVAVVEGRVMRVRRALGRARRRRQVSR